METDRAEEPVQLAPTRRQVLRWIGAGLGSAGMLPALLDACSVGSQVASSNSGDVTWAASAFPIQMDPHRHTPVQNEQYVYAQLYDFLLARDHDFKLIPNVASSWKRLDDTTWQFKLRNDIKFHNGDRLTAADVKFSIERTYDPAIKSIYAGRYSSIIDHIDVLDDTTVNMTTKSPDLLFPGRFAWFPAWILPQKYISSVGPDGFSQKPVGSGPMRLDQMTQNVRIVLKPNTSYWGGQTNVRQLTIIPRTDASARIASLQTGEANFIDSVPFDQIGPLSTGNTTVGLLLDRSQFLIQSNTAIPPLDKTAVRQALSLAIDRESIVKNIFGGKVRASTSPLIPGDDAFDASAPVLPFDQDKARSTLKDGGYNNEPIVFEWAANLATPVDPELNQALVAMWKAVGLNVVSQEEDLAVLKAKFASRAWKGIFVTAFSSTLGDLDGSLWSSMKPGSVSGRFWNNAEFDRLGFESSASQDPALRLKDHQEMVQLILNEMPIIPIFQVAFTFGMTRSFRWNPTPTGDLFSRISLSFTG